VDNKTSELDVLRREGAIEIVEGKWVRRGWRLRNELVVVDHDTCQQDDWTVDLELLRTRLHRQGILTEESQLCSPLQLEVPEVAIESLEVLLGLKPTQFSDGRAAILICEVCLDLFCPAITATVQFTDDEVIWVGFGWQSLTEDGLLGKVAPSLGFHFGRKAYEATLTRLLDRYRKG